MTRETNSGMNRRTIFLIVASSGALLLWPTLLRGPLDGHEVLVGQTAREMLRSGDWILPRFAGEVRLQKPPLAYWMSAACGSLTGQIGRLEARLPSSLAIILLAGVLAGWMQRRVGGHVGLLTGLVLMSSFWGLRWGKSATIDASLTFLTTVAILAADADRWGLRWSATQHVSLWGALLGTIGLAKGPVTLPAVVIIVVLRRWSRQPSPTDLKWLRPIPVLAGLTCFLLIALPWPLTIWLTQPDALALWQAQSMDRYLTHWGPNTKPPWYYVGVVPMLTLPWTPFWLIDLRRRRRDDVDRLLLQWFGVMFVFFTLSAGKRDHYILPALPPLACWAGRSLHHWLCSSRTVRIGCLRLAGVALLVGANWCCEPFISPPTTVDPALERLIADQRTVLDQSDLVVQLGWNDRSTIFEVDRPMCWPRAATNWVEALQATPSALILVETSMLDAIDRQLPVRRLATAQGQRRQWMLFAPLPTTNPVVSSALTGTP